MYHLELTDLDLRLEEAIVEEAAQIGLNAKLNFYSRTQLPTTDNLPKSASPDLTALLLHPTDNDLSNLPESTIRRMAVGWEMIFGIGEPPEAVKSMAEKMIGEAHLGLDQDGLSTVLLNIRLVDPDMF